MKHYTEQELDAKIQAFLTNKLQEYPELDMGATATHVTHEANLPAWLREPLTFFSPVLIH